LTGALYLGELIRRILLKLTKDKILFCGEKVEALEKVDGFPAKYISEIFRFFWKKLKKIFEIFSSEPGEMRKNCRKICDEMEVQNHGSIDYFIMQEVCIAASERSAGVVAAGFFFFFFLIGKILFARK